MGAHFPLLLHLDHVGEDHANVLRRVRRLPLHAHGREPILERERHHVALPRRGRRRGSIHKDTEHHRPIYLTNDRASGYEPPIPTTLHFCNISNFSKSHFHESQFRHAHRCPSSLASGALDSRSRRRMAAAPGTFPEGLVPPAAPPAAVPGAPSPGGGAPFPACHIRRRASPPLDRPPPLLHPTHGRMGGASTRARMACAGWLAGCEPWLGQRIPFFAEPQPTLEAPDWTPLWQELQPRHRRRGSRKLQAGVIPRARRLAHTPCRWPTLATALGPPWAHIDPLSPPDTGTLPWAPTTPR